jgi:serine protease AprX
MQHFITLILVLAFLPQEIMAQISPNHYLVNLTDKKNSVYSVDRPHEFLSQRAIQRRIRYKIALNENDLPVNHTYIDGLKSLGLKIHNISKWTNSVVVYSTDTLLLDTLHKKLPYVKSVGFQKIKKQPGTKNLAQKSAINAFGVKTVDSITSALYGQSFNQIKMHNGHLLHKEGFQGQGMHIAILDGGFYRVNDLPAFDDFRKNKQLLGTRDFVRDNLNVYNSSDHGMKVLSTMAGHIPGRLLGTAPKASYWLLRTEQTSSEYMIEEHNWLAAVEFADSAGVDIINSSLGYNVFDDKTSNHQYRDMDGNTALITIAADLAANKGMLVVTSAGNEGFGTWGYITAPADADSILTVGAVMNDGRLAYFSSKGPTSDSRMKPDVCALGLSPAVSGIDGRLSYASGTSYSSPIMAGLVACLWQAHPGLNNMEIIDILRRSSSQYNKPDTLYGFGVPDIYAAHIYLNTSGFIHNPSKGDMHIFPNPFKDAFNVEFYSKSIEIPFDLRMEMFDIQGKKMLDKFKPGLLNSFNVSHFGNLESISNGVYLFRLNANNFSMEKKLIKQ